MFPLAMFPLARVTWSRVSMSVATERQGALVPDRP
jgi:hypothetical protein